MRVNSGQMSLQDFVRASATPADEVLAYIDSHQICTFAVLDTYDLVLQNKRYILKGLDVTTPSLKIDSPLQLTTVETIGLVFGEEAPEMLMVVEREDLPKAIQKGDHLVKKPNTLQNFILVVLGVHTAQEAHSPRWPSAAVRNAMEPKPYQAQDWIAWILVCTGESCNCAKLPIFKTLPLMEPGRTTDLHIFSYLRPLLTCRPFTRT